MRDSATSDGSLHVACSTRPAHRTRRSQSDGGQEVRRLVGYSSSHVLSLYLPFSSPRSICLERTVKMPWRPTSKFSRAYELKASSSARSHFRVVNFLLVPCLFVSRPCSSSPCAVAPCKCIMTRRREQKREEGEEEGEKHTSSCGLSSVEFWSRCYFLCWRVGSSRP